MSDYKCPHCDYYMWEGKEFYECDTQDKVSKLEQENAELIEDNLNLSKENELLKAEFEIESLTDKTTKKTIYRSNLVNKYRTTLQETKKIAEERVPFIDFSETKTATEVEYDYAAICNELELRLYKVLELITKAESEG